MKVPPTSTPDIRGMTAADLPAVMAIQAACYTELVPESQASLDAKRVASPSTCLVATRDGVLVASTAQEGLIRVVESGDS